MGLGEEEKGRRCSGDSAEGNWGEEGAEWMGRVLRRRQDEKRSAGTGGGWGDAG